MAYSTDNRNEPSRRFGVDRSNGALWLIAGIVAVLAIIGLISWGETSRTVVPATDAPQVENKVDSEPPAQPAPSNTTKMDAQPSTEAPAPTTVAPSPAEPPPATATEPAQPPAANP